MKSNLTSNHLDAARLAYLDASVFEIISKQELSEFELIKLLQSEPYEIFSEDALSQSLSLFHTHFILFNSLYRLKRQGEMLQTFTIQISALAIKLVVDDQDDKSNCNDKERNVSPVVDANLQEFYLDWNNFDIEQTEVDALLQSFWDRYNSRHQNKLSQALSTFGYTEMPSKHQLKASFKKKSLVLHPDRGGSNEAFTALLSAYQVINTAL